MTLGLALTILLAVLDYTGQVHLSGVQIFLPMIIEFVVYLIVLAIVLLGVVVGTKSIDETLRRTRR